MSVNQSGTLVGLNTYSYAAPAAGPYSIDGKIILPKIVDGDTGTSQVVVAVNKNGSGAFYTGTAGADGFHCDTVCVAGDVINVVTSSAAAVDQGLNVIKVTIAISSGVA